MQCDNNIQLIEREDFDCIGNVAIHCDNQKLCIAINQAQDFDMSELFCDYWEVIVNIWEEIQAYQDNPELPQPENYELKLSLLCGGYYEGCNGKTRRHFGIKRMLVYYSYARYVLINANTDTAVGLKQKTNEFSMPTPLKEVQTISDQYRTMGYQSYKKTLDFLCINNDILEFESKECKPCGCHEGNCGGKTKAKGYGIKFNTVRKL